MFEAIGGRKFIFGLLIIVGGALAELFGKNGLSANLVALMGTIYTIFSTANAITTIKVPPGQPVTQPTEEISVPSPMPQEENKSAPPVEVERLRADLIPILNQIGVEFNNLNQAVQVNQQSLNTIQKILLALSNK